MQSPETEKQLPEARRKTGAHLLRHQVTPEIAEAAAVQFGSDADQAGKAILNLRQPQLRNVFQKVFSVTTASGNNDWMRSKLLQAVGLSPKWRPEPEAGAEGGSSSGAAPSGGPPEPKKRQRKRRQPAPQQDSMSSEGSGQKLARRGSAASQHCGAATVGAVSQRAWPASASPSVAAAEGSGSGEPGEPPMVVVMVSDAQGQVPAWPGYMQLPPGAAAAAAAPPFVQTEGGGWRLLPDHLMFGQDIDALARETFGEAQARGQARPGQQDLQELQQQLAAQQARELQQLAQLQAQQQQQLQAQQAQQHALLAERQMAEAHRLGMPPAQHVQHAQQRFAAPIPIEDVVIPAQHGAGVRLAAWDALRAAGILPFAHHPPAPAAHADVAPPIAAPPPRGGMWVQGGAVNCLAVTRLQPQTVAGAAALQGPAAAAPLPSPFAAEASVPLTSPRGPPEERPDMLARHPLASLLLEDFQGEISLLGMSDLGAPGVSAGAGVPPTALPTAQSSSLDLQRLFNAWQEGRLSISLSRRDVPSIPSDPLSASFGADG